MVVEKTIGIKELIESFGDSFPNLLAATLELMGDDIPRRFVCAVNAASTNAELNKMHMIYELGRFIIPGEIRAKAHGEMSHAHGVNIIFQLVGETGISTAELEKLGDELQAILDNNTGLSNQADDSALRGAIYAAFKIVELYPDDFVIDDCND